MLFSSSPRLRDIYAFNELKKISASRGSAELTRCSMYWLYVRPLLGAFQASMALKMAGRTDQHEACIVDTLSDSRVKEWWDSTYYST